MGAFFRAGHLAATAVAMGLSACAFDPLDLRADFPTFNRGPITGDYIYDIPVDLVVRQVKCEFGAFLRHWKTEYEKRTGRKGVNIDLNKDRSVITTLTLKTTSNASVGYTGIDLKRIGLSNLATVISSKSNSPSLGVDASGQSTVSVDIKLALSQKPEDLKVKGECFSGPLDPLMHKLFLQEWLTSFFITLNESKEIASKELNSLTLTTDFQFVVNISTGFAPIFGPTYILPISGENAGWKNSYTHTLKLEFNGVSK
jgi:hypothetical protein